MVHDIFEIAPEPEVMKAIDEKYVKPMLYLGKDDTDIPMDYLRCVQTMTTAQTDATDMRNLRELADGGAEMCYYHDHPEDEFCPLRDEENNGIQGWVDEESPELA